jgi:nitrogen fixation protein FixH
MERTAWRFYPWIIAAGMSVVVAVNIGMISFALYTFPGKAPGGEGFDLSNRYNAVIVRAQDQAALGWTIGANSDRLGHPLLDLTDPGHAPLAHARITATADRPVGAALTTLVTFAETTPGHYVGDVSLPVQGQWELLLTASVGGHNVTATRRIVVK